MKNQKNQKLKFANTLFVKQTTPLLSRNKKNPIIRQFKSAVIYRPFFVMFQYVHVLILIFKINLVARYGYSNYLNSSMFRDMTTCYMQVVGRFQDFTSLLLRMKGLIFYFSHEIKLSTKFKTLIDKTIFYVMDPNIVVGIC